MFTPVPEDIHIYVEAPPEAGLRSDQCWRLRRAMNGLRVSSRLFQDHHAKILRAGGFEQSKAEKRIQAGILQEYAHSSGNVERSVVGTAGMKSEKTQEADEYIGEEDHKVYRSVCGRLQFASSRRPVILFTLKELGRGLAKPLKSHYQLMRDLRGSTETVLVHMSERTERGIIKAQADSDWAGCHSTRKSTCCGVIWWSGVLISSYARTQSTIATSSAESEYYGACAVASEAVYVEELLKFIGNDCFPDWTVPCPFLPKATFHSQGSVGRPSTPRHLMSHQPGT
eukprot:128866-Amphidinium_carterae.2